MNIEEWIKSTKKLNSMPRNGKLHHKSFVNPKKIMGYLPIANGENEYVAMGLCPRCRREMIVLGQESVCTDCYEKLCDSGADMATLHKNLSPIPVVKQTDKQSAKEPPKNDSKPVVVQTEADELIFDLRSIRSAGERIVREVKNEINEMRKRNKKIIDLFDKFFK